jgi:hypothetical protein
MNFCVGGIPPVPPRKYLSENSGGISPVGVRKYFLENSGENKLRWESENIS